MLGYTISSSLQVHFGQAALRTSANSSEAHVHVPLAPPSNSERAAVTLSYLCTKAALDALHSLRGGSIDFPEVARKSEKRHS